MLSQSIGGNQSHTYIFFFWTMPMVALQMANARVIIFTIKPYAMTLINLHIGREVESIRGFHARLDLTFIWHAFQARSAHDEIAIFSIIHLLVRSFVRLFVMVFFSRRILILTLSMQLHRCIRMRCIWKCVWHTSNRCLLLSLSLSFSFCVVQSIRYFQLYCDAISFFAMHFCDILMGGRKMNCKWNKNNNKTQQKQWKTPFSEHKAHNRA